MNRRDLLLGGVATVASSAARDSLHPVPALDRRVFRSDLRVEQRWDGARWVDEGVAVVGGEAGVTDTRFPVGDFRRYGADPAGVADSTAAIQAAVTAARAARTAVGAPGVFRVTAPIVLGSDVLSFVPLRGSGANVGAPQTQIVGRFAGPLLRLSGTATGPDSVAYSDCGSVRDVSLKQLHPGGGCIEAAYTAVLALESVEMEMPGGGYGIGSARYGISAELHNVQIYGAAGSKGISGSYYNLKIFGGRIYGCDYAIDLGQGESLVAVGLNSEFCRVFFRHSALQAAAFLGCHVETTDVLLTNAYAPPISAASGTPWGDAGGKGAALLGGSVLFLNCRTLLTRTDTDHVVIKPEDGFQYRLRFEGCAHGAPLRCSGVFTFNRNAELPVGTTIEFAGNSGGQQYNNPGGAYGKTKDETRQTYLLSAFGLPSGHFVAADGGPDRPAVAAVARPAAGQASLRIVPVAGAPARAFNAPGNVAAETTRGIISFSASRAGSRAGYWNGVRTMDTGAPTSGTWVQGDMVWNMAPTEQGPAGARYVDLGWVCTAGGTPGSWVPTRTLTGN
jgi:hypothetical protein